jgi:hypothetical protein
VKDERCALLCLDLLRAEAISRVGLDIEAAQEAAERARALSDPTRLIMADALRKGDELCVCATWPGSPSALRTYLVGRSAAVIADGDGCEDDCCAPGSCGVDDHGRRAVKAVARKL